MNSTFGFVLLAVVCSWLCACGRDGEGTIGAFSTEPPVTANTPLGFRIRSETFQLNIVTFPKIPPGILKSRTALLIKEKFFSAGPTDVASLLAAVDYRMEELDSLEAEEHHDCLDDSLVEFEITNPLNLGMKHYLNCRNEVNPYDWVGFGRKEGTWYLREGTIGGSGVLASVDSDENVEAWIGVANGEEIHREPQSILHLKSTKQSGLLEFTVTGGNIGLGCGLHFQSNRDYIYVTGKIDDTLDCYGVRVTSVCVKAADLTTTENSHCSSAGLDTFTMKSLDRQSIDFYEIHRLLSQPIEGLNQF